MVFVRRINQSFQIDHEGESDISSFKWPRKYCKSLQHLIVCISKTILYAYQHDLI